VLGNFSPWKIRRLRPGLKPRTWVLEASTHPLDNRNRLFYMLRTWRSKSVCSNTGAVTDVRGMRLKLSDVSFGIEQLAETYGYTLVGYIFKRWKGATRYYC
jgi:hypothetical protein